MRCTLFHVMKRNLDNQILPHHSSCWNPQIGAFLMCHRKMSEETLHSTCCHHWRREDGCWDIFQKLKHTCMIHLTSNTLFKCLSHLSLLDVGTLEELLYHLRQRMRKWREWRTSTMSAKSSWRLRLVWQTKIIWTVFVRRHELLFGRLRYREREAFLLIARHSVSLLFFFIRIYCSERWTFYFARSKSMIVRGKRREIFDNILALID